jgi:hypothetical protein
VYGFRLLRKRPVQFAALGILALVVLGYRAVQLVGLSREIQWGYDFSAYWSAAGRLLAGASPYGPQQLAGTYSPQQQFLYLYPPPLAAFLTPLHQLFPDDYRAAAGVWAVAGAAIVVACVLALAKSERLGARYPLLAGRGAWLLVAAAFAFPPVVGELVLGNVHLLLLGLLTAAWLGLRRGDARGEWVAGFAVGAAAIVKVFPALLLVWFLLTRRWRAAAGFVLAMAVLAIVALPITGVQPWLDYPTVLANLGAPTDTRDTLSPTVWLAPILGFAAARVLVTVLGVAIVGWSSLRSSAPRSFAAAVAVSVLVAPAVYQHYLAVLVLPLLLGLGAGASLPALAAAYLLMWGGQQDALGDLAWIVDRALPTIGALLLVAALLVPRRADAHAADPSHATPSTAV